MTTRDVATAQWRALDRDGEDKCRLCRGADGWLLIGHARFRDTDGAAALDYVIRCDSAWRTLSADIAGLHGGLEVSLRILRENARWWLNDIEQPAVAGVHDLDLAFTPATNLMPLRRLAESERKRIHLSAAWLRYPQTALTPVRQTYARTEQAGRIAYRNSDTGQTATLTVDESGLVIHYPDAWEGEVTHAV